MSGQHKKSTNLIVGVVILLSLVILIGGVRFLNESRFRESTHEVRAIFDNVGTLTEGDPVKVNGVKKGKVKTITLQGNRVEVLMAINREVSLTRDSRIVIQNIGLMGERMIGIQLGTGPALPEGESMTGEFDSGIAEAMGMLGEVLEQVQVAVGDLQKVINQTVGNEEFRTRFENITSRLDHTTEIMDRMITENRAPLESSIGDLSSTASNVRKFMDTNKEKLDLTVGNIAEISEQSKALLTRADRITSDIESLVSKLNSDKSSLGRMINDTLFVEQLKKTITNADSLVQQVRKDGIKVGLW